MKMFSKRPFSTAWRSVSTKELTLKEGVFRGMIGVNLRLPRLLESMLAQKQKSIELTSIIHKTRMNVDSDSFGQGQSVYHLKTQAMNHMAGQTILSNLHWLRVQEPLNNS